MLTFVSRETILYAKTKPLFVKTGLMSSYVQVVVQVHRARTARPYRPSLVAHNITTQNLRSQSHARLQKTFAREHRLTTKAFCARGRAGNKKLALASYSSGDFEGVPAFRGYCFGVGLTFSISTIHLCGSSDKRVYGCFT